MSTGTLESFDVDARAVKFYEPHASAFMSAESLGKVAQALLDDGDPLLDSSSRSSLFSPRFPKFEGEGTFASAGLHVRRLGDHDLVFHTGSFAGFSAFMVLVPEVGFGSVWLQNGPSSVDATEAIDSAIEAYLGDVPAQVEPQGPPPDSEIVGTYRASTFGEVEVRRNGSLEIAFASTGMSVPLIHLSGSMFYFPITEAIEGLPPSYYGIGMPAVFFGTSDQGQFLASRIGVAKRQ